MRTVRIAISGPSPCDRCVAACCKQWGPDYAVLLRGDEVRRFAPFATQVPIDAGGRLVVEHVLPYVDGRCQFLGSDDRCTIYDDRPQSCRDFECVPHFNRDGVGRHGAFLRGNPQVLAVLQHLAPGESTV